MIASSLLEIILADFRFQWQGPYTKSRLEIISDAGHSASEPGITDALVRATDEFLRLSVC